MFITLQMQSLGVSFSRIFKPVVIKKCRQIGKQMFSKYLLITNISVSLALSGTGDILEQCYEINSKKIEGWDTVRTRNMATSGMVVGVICHYWYKFLDKKLPGRTIKVVCQKVLFDQIIFSPVYISGFLITMGILEKSSSDRIKQEVIYKGWRLYVAEWIIWPPAQVINFYFLPNRFRVLYDNTISLGYDVYTSYVKHDDDDDEECDISTRVSEISEK